MTAPVRLLLGAVVLVLAPAGAVLPALAQEVRANAAADRLVGLLLPRDSLVALAVKAFDKGFDDRLGADRALAARLDALPGAREAVAARLKPEMARVLTANLPTLRARIAAILATDLDAEELADATAFFASPAGAKVRAEVYETLADLPEADVAATRQSVLTSVMTKLAPADYPAVIAFGASPAAQKIEAVNPRIAAASSAWAEALLAAHRPRFRTLAEQALRELGAKGERQ